MKDAQKPDHINLSGLVTRLKDGRYVVPDFQREFEWGPGDISDLMRSIFSDYYVGSLLLWKGKKENFEALACEPLYGFGRNGDQREHIVLDGQQRLTAMHYAFFAPDKPLPNKKNRYLYFVRVDQFMGTRDEDSFFYDWTRRGPKLLANVALQYEQHTFPLAVIGRGGFDLFEWAQGYREHWQQAAERFEKAGRPDEAESARSHADNGKAFGLLMKELLEQYRIAYIELERDLEVEKVCDIFTKINSRGIQLDVFDLMNALLKPKQLQLKLLWRAAEPRLGFVRSAKLNVYVLQVMSILKQAYCSPKYLYYLLPGYEKQVRSADGSLVHETLVRNVDEFRTLWERAVTALQDVIDLLKHPQEFGVTSTQYLPYVAILPVFAALQSHVQTLHAERRLNAQRKVRDWYWASVFTARYSSTVESTSARDFVDVRDWMRHGDTEPSVIQEFRTHFKNLELRKETKRGTSIYNGMFNLLVLNGASDWITGTCPKPEDLDDHHIVPKSWGGKHAVGPVVDSILNRTPLTAETNRRVIRDRLPNEYLPELMAQNGDKLVREVLLSHGVSSRAIEILLRDPFTPTDFEEFIADRQRTLQELMETLLVKQRSDLSPALRELDRSIEQVELALRDCVKTALVDDSSLVPSQVAERVEERIQRALKKNPAMDADHYAELGGQLEYFDFRELEDTMKNKLLWPRFSERFGSNEALAAKFNQLADLRNAIRHSRTVDDVVRVEGQAAILWFRKILKIESASRAS